MRSRAITLRRHLLLLTALTMVEGMAGVQAARAQAAAAPVVVPGDGAASDLNAYQIKKVQILYKKLLLKEKDLPSAVTHWTARTSRRPTRPWGRSRHC